MGKWEEVRAEYEAIEKKRQKFFTGARVKLKGRVYDIMQAAKTDHIKRNPHGVSWGGVDSYSCLGTTKVNGRIISVLMEHLEFRKKFKIYTLNFSNKTFYEFKVSIEHRDLEGPYKAHYNYFTDLILSEIDNATPDDDLQIGYQIRMTPEIYQYCFDEESYKLLPKDDMKYFEEVFLSNILRGKERMKNLAA